MRRVPSDGWPPRVRALVVLGALGAAHAALGAEPFRFAWPLPTTTTIKAAIDKRGQTSTALYEIALTPADDGELALEFRDFRFLSLNGISADDPRVKAQLGPLAALTAALPTMRLSADGEYLGTIGLAPMLDRMLEAMPETMDAATRARLSEYFQSPKVQQLMQQKSGEFWNVWVGAWNGVDLDPGESLTGTVPVAVMDRELTQHVRVEHLGQSAEHNCCVRLRMTTVVEGPDVLQLLSSVLGEIAQTMERDGRRFDPSQFVAARSMNVTEVVTDPATLMPRYALSVSDVVIREADDSEHARSDRKEFWFDWH